MSIKKFITVFFPLLVLIVALVSIVIGIFIQNSINKVWEKFIADEVMRDFSERIELEKEKAKNIVDKILADENIIAAFQNKDREKLIETITPYQKTFESIGLYQFHFHTEDGISFLRTSNPNKYGDDLKTYRKDILEIKQSLKPIASIYSNDSGVILRYTAPVFFNGKYIGNLEADIKIFDENTFLKSDSEKRILVIVYDENVNKIDKVIKPSDVEDFTNNLNKNKIYNGFLDMISKRKSLYVGVPIKNDKGETFAALYIKRDITNVSYYRLLGLILQISIITLVTIFVLIITSKTGKKIQKRFDKFILEVEKIASGNFDIQLETTENDEISQMGNKLAEATKKFREMLDNINETATNAEERISEFSKISESIISTASSTSEIKSMSENTENASKELDKSLEEFAAYVEESSAELESILKRIKEFTDIIEQITSSASHLASQTSLLNNFTEKITEISDNITVLAINASIETSKQNIDRDGLSRISEMIMELSESSRQLTKESKQSLKSLEESITSTILLAEKVTKDLSSVKESLNIISDVMNALVGNVSNLTKISRVTHEAVEQTYAGVEQLEEAINVIKDEIEKFQNSFVELIDAFKRLKT